jgi:hypothetical protein
MIEVSRKFPTPEAPDRIAGALDIKTYQLFAVPVSPEETLERLHNTLAARLERLIGEAVKKAVAENCPRRPPDGSNGSK